MKIINFTLMFRTTPVLLFLISTSITFGQSLDKPSSGRPEISHEDEIFVWKDIFYGEVQVLRIKQEGIEGERIFIRNEHFGRYLNKEEENSLIEKSFFERIRSTNPLLSALHTVWHLDQGAEFVSFSDSDAPMTINLWSRAIKGALLGSTVLAGMNSLRKSADLSDSIPYLSQPAAYDRFSRSRNIYYGIGSLTIGYFLYCAIWAYFNSGKNENGLDLNLLQRRKIDSDQFLNPSNLNFRERSIFVFSFSVVM